MGKRYKTGNVGRKRGVKPKQIYYKREKKINELINLFKNNYYCGLCSSNAHCGYCNNCKNSYGSSACTFISERKYLYSRNYLL